MEWISHNQTIVAALIAGIIAWLYNRSRISLDRAVFKRELFLRYNERYDTLNDHLESLSHAEFETDRDHQLGNGKSLDDVWEELFEEPGKPSPIIAAAFDYINLCSEQYYWFKKDFVDHDVWTCWSAGMKEWYTNSYFIRKIIERERERKSSYYNEDFLDIFGTGS